LNQASFVESYKKLDIFRAVVSQIKNAKGILPSVTLSVESNNFIETVTKQVSLLPTEKILATFDVRFDGENGTDQGALTGALYRRYFSQIFLEANSLFEKSANGRYYLPISGNLSPQQEKLFEVFGILLIRTIYDERTMPIPLAPAVFKYTFDKRPNLRDLEIFDPEEYRKLQRLLALPNAQQCGLNFNGLKDNDTSIAVTDANKQEYVNLRVYCDF
jgi:hypothetical protein